MTARRWYSAYHFLWVQRGLVDKCIRDTARIIGYLISFSHLSYVHLAVYATQGSSLYWLYLRLLNFCWSGMCWNFFLFFFFTLSCFYWKCLFIPSLYFGSCLTSWFNVLGVQTSLLLVFHVSCIGSWTCNFIFTSCWSTGNFNEWCGPESMFWCILGPLSIGIDY